MLTLPIAVLAIAFIVALIHRPSHSTSFLPTPTRILLVTAHPDDESFFFAPTLLSLLTYPTSTPGLSPVVFSLCLSIGDADGLGAVRKEELASSLDVLGIDKSRRWVVDSPHLRDNITAFWDPQTIARIVEPYVTDNHVTTILTFDNGGVSGHPNHISIPAGISHLLNTFKTATPNNKPRLYTLLTVPLHLKYIGPLAKMVVYVHDTVYSRIFPREDVLANTHLVFMSGLNEYGTASRAVLAHQSQMVWFRWLYMVHSRYMWVNEWVEVV